MSITEEEYLVSDDEWKEVPIKKRPTRPKESKPVTIDDGWQDNTRWKNFEHQVVKERERLQLWLIGVLTQNRHNESSMPLARRIAYRDINKQLNELL